MGVDVATELPKAETSKPIAPDVSTKPREIPGLSSPLSADTHFEQAQRDSSQATMQEADTIRQDQVRRELFIEKKLDPRLRKYARNPGYTAIIESDKDEKIFEEQVTNDYIKGLLNNKHLPDISPEEANEAFNQILSEQARLQQVVNEAKEKGLPIPEDIRVDGEGKVIMSEAQDTAIALQSVREPRINQRIPDLLRELGPIYRRHEAYIKELLTTDPTISEKEIGRKIDETLTAQSQAAIDKALKGEAGKEGEHGEDHKKRLKVELDNVEHQALMIYVTDKYEREGDIKSADLYPLIREAAAKIKVETIIDKIVNDPHQYPFTFNKQKIIDAVLDGKDPFEMVDKYKKGANPTVGSTIKQMLQDIWKRMFS